MPEATFTTVTIKQLEIIAPGGTANAPLVPDLMGDQLRRTYYLLLLTGTYDGRARALQRKGRIDTSPSVLGQEATTAATGHLAP